MFLLSVIFLLLTVQVHATEREDLLHVYNTWSRLPSKDLCDKAYSYLSRPATRDSALVCYNILQNRYNDHQIKSGDEGYVVNALTNMGIMYMTFYYDYKKSYEYLLLAERVALEHHYLDKLPSIYVAQANVMQMGELQFSDEEVIGVLRKAFRQATEDRVWDMVELSLSDLLDECIEKGRIADVREDIESFRHLSNYRDAGQRTSVEWKCKAAEAVGRGDYVVAGDCYMAASTIAPDTILAARKQMNDLLRAGECYSKGRNFQKAEFALRQALSLAQVNGNNDYLKSIYEELGNMYRSLGDTEKQQYNEYLSLKYKDSLMTEGRLANVASVKLTDELNSMNQTVRALNEKRRLQSILLIVAVLVVLVISFLSYRLYRSYRLVQADHYRLYLNNVELLRREAEEQERIAELKRQVEESVRRIGARKETEVQSAESSVGEPKRRTADTLERKEMEEVFQKVKDVMNYSSEIFSYGFTLNRLADLVGLRHHLVSQAINEVYGHNFNVLLNEYRIKEACRRLNNRDEYGNFSIEGIAQSVGFKSRTNFSALFKQTTGLTPSEYQKLSRKPKA